MGAACLPSYSSSLLGTFVCAIASMPADSQPARSTPRAGTLRSRLPDRESASAGIVPAAAGARSRDARPGADQPTRMVARCRSRSSTASSSSIRRSPIKPALAAVLASLARRAHLDVRAAQGRQVSQWARGRRGRRRLFVLAHPRSKDEVRRGRAVPEHQGRARFRDRANARERSRAWSRSTGTPCRSRSTQADRTVRVSLLAIGQAKIVPRDLVGDPGDAFGATSGRHRTVPIRPLGARQGDRARREPRLLRRSRRKIARARLPGLPGRSARRDARRVPEGQSRGCDRCRCAPTGERWLPTKATST